MDKDILGEKMEQLERKSMLKEKMEQLERKIGAVKSFAEIGAYMADSKTVTPEAYKAYKELRHWLFEVDK